MPILMLEYQPYWPKQRHTCDLGTEVIYSNRESVLWFGKPSCEHCRISSFLLPISERDAAICEWLHGVGDGTQSLCLSFAVGFYFDIFTLLRENSTERSSSAMKRTRKEHLWTVALLNAKRLPLQWIISRCSETLFKGFAKYSLWKRTDSILNSHWDQKWPWVKLWTGCFVVLFLLPFPPSVVALSLPPKPPPVSWSLPLLFLFVSFDWEPRKHIHQ